MPIPDPPLPPPHGGALPGCSLLVYLNIVVLSLSGFLQHVFNCRNVSKLLNGIASLALAEVVIHSGKLIA